MPAVSFKSSSHHRAFLAARHRYGEWAIFQACKVKGEFPFHAHADEDEFFLVHHGEFTVCYRDREVALKAGDFHVVPRGVEHRPRATEEQGGLLSRSGRSQFVGGLA